MPPRVMEGVRGTEARQALAVSHVLSEQEWEVIRRRDPDFEACRQLWCAVFEMQRFLACDARPNRNANGASPAEIDAARRWFGSRDFYMVCSLSGQEPDYVLPPIQDAIARAKRPGSRPVRR